MFRRWLAYEPPKGQFASSVLVIAVPILLLAILGFVSGSMYLGTPELTGLMLIWIGALTWIWVVPLIRHTVHPQASKDFSARR
jgi:hypothetical protein